jgi:hypothetical protein
MSNADPTPQMPDRVRRGDLTLPMVLNGLPLAQLYGLCVTVAGLLAASCTAGIWLSNQGSQYELRQVTEELAETNKKLSDAQEQITLFQIKQRFFATCLTYYQAEGAEHEIAERAFVAYLKEMWKNGNQDLEKNGYEIYHNPDSPTKACYITFKNDPARYRIPPGAKGEVLSFLR